MRTQTQPPDLKKQGLGVAIRNSPPIGSIFYMVFQKVKSAPVLLSGSWPSWSLSHTSLGSPECLLMCSGVHVVWGREWSNRGLTVFMVSSPFPLYSDESAVGIVHSAGREGMRAECPAQSWTLKKVPEGWGTSPPSLRNLAYTSDWKPGARFSFLSF